jgi:amino acid transporter
MPTVSSSYWLLTAMTAQLAMIVYLGLFAAAIYLRFKHPDVHRPFKIPFGKPGILVVCGVGILSCLVAIGLGFIPPSQISVGSTVVYESLLIGGGLLLSLPPVYFYYFGNSRK